MLESDLKRALIKSLIAQEGEGFRIEDRYRLGVPDCLMLPEGLPGFLVEAKILRGPRLVCTPTQRLYLEKFHQPPRFLTALIGYSERLGALYIGGDGDALEDCRYVLRPTRLISSTWPITELLWKRYYDETAKADTAREARPRRGRLVRGTAGGGQPDEGL